jgi:hypothetical protein
MKRPAWLQRLLERGATAYSAVDCRIADELLSLGIVRIESAGLRQTLNTADVVQLGRWIEAHYPLHDLEPEMLAPREANIVRGGSSKCGKRAHAILPVLFKWFGNGPLAQWTDDYGMAAVFSDRLGELPVPLSWRLLTIENWEPFQRVEYDGAAVPIMAIYLGGNVSDRVVTALNRFRHPPEKITHCGDYDWEGLLIFQRLQKNLPAAELYVPTNLETLFQQFGSRKLLEKQKRKVGFDPQNAQCLPVIRLIEQYNAGLEQEAVGLPT